MPFCHLSTAFSEMPAAPSSSHVAAVHMFGGGSKMVAHVCLML
jgi:hypothetical protein